MGIILQFKPFITLIRNSPKLILIGLCSYFAVFCILGFSPMIASLLFILFVSVPFVLKRRKSQLGLLLFCGYAGVTAYYRAVGFYENELPNSPNNIAYLFNIENAVRNSPKGELWQTHTTLDEWRVLLTAKGITRVGYSPAIGFNFELTDLILQYQLIPVLVDRFAPLNHSFVVVTDSKEVTNFEGKAYHKIETVGPYTLMSRDGI